MTIDERAQIIWDELTTFKHHNPVGWLAAALRQFRCEIVAEVANPTSPETPVDPPTGSHLTLVAGMSANPDGE